MYQLTTRCGELVTDFCVWNCDIVVSCNRCPKDFIYPTALASLLFSTQYWNIMSHLVLYALLAPIYYSSPLFAQFWVSQFFCSCSYHLEFPSLEYSKQFYDILFSPPTQNLFQSSFSASLVPHPTPSPALQIRPVNRRHCALYKFIYLLIA